MKKIRLTESEIDIKLALLKETLLSSSKVSASISMGLDIPKEEQVKATVNISPLAWGKMQALVKVCDKEIAWHATVVRGDSKGKFLVEDVVVFDQVVSAAHVDTDEGKYGAWLATLPDDVFNKLRFHGHSHVNMAVNPSGVDTNYWDGILENGVEDFYIFGIFNKTGTIHMVIFDIENNIQYESTDVTVCLQWAIDEIESHVTTMVTAVTKPATETTYGTSAFPDWWVSGREVSRTSSPTAGYDTVQMQYTMDNKTNNVATVWIILPTGVDPDDLTGVQVKYVKTSTEFYKLEFKERTDYVANFPKVKKYGAIGEKKNQNITQGQTALSVTTSTNNTTAGTQTIDSYVKELTRELPAKVKNAYNAIDWGYIYRNIFVLTGVIQYREFTAKILESMASCCESELMSVIEDDILMQEYPCVNAYILESTLVEYAFTQDEQLLGAGSNMDIVTLFLSMPEEILTAMRNKGDKQKVAKFYGIKLYPHRR